jgi:WD40 repeat protein
VFSFDLSSEVDRNEGRRKLHLVATAVHAWFRAQMYCSSCAASPLLEAGLKFASVCSCCNFLRQPDACVLSGCFNGDIFVFDTEDGGRTTLSRTLHHHDHAITSLASSSDYLVAADDEGGISVWNAQQSLEFSIEGYG